MLQTPCLDPLTTQTFYVHCFYVQITKLHSLDAIFFFLARTPASCQTQKMTALVVNLATFWCINFINKQNTIGSFDTYSLAAMSITSDTYELCRPAALHPISCLHITSKNPDSSSPALPLSPFALLTFSPPSSSPSIHLLSEPLSGARAVVCKAYLGCGVSLEMRLVCI